MVDIWREKILKDLEAGTLKYAIVEKFLINLKKEFDKEDDKIMKVTELKKVKQGSITMEKFMQNVRVAKFGLKLFLILFFISFLFDLFSI